MKIIKEGNIKETIFICNDCKCEFSLTDKEINENTELIENNYLTYSRRFYYLCPCCKSNNLKRKDYE